MASSFLLFISFSKANSFVRSTLYSIFVDFDDLWYFQNYDLVVSYHKETEEI